MIVVPHRENRVISNNVGGWSWWKVSVVAIRVHIGPKVLVELKIRGPEAGPNRISDG